MKVVRKLKSVPSGRSLSISLQYGLGDIKAALLEIRRRVGQNESVSMKDLIQMLYDIATDSHMQREPRRYIAEWMARRAEVEGFIFKANDYLGQTFDGSDTYLIDTESIREKMRGRKPKEHQIV